MPCDALHAASGIDASRPPRAYSVPGSSSSPPSHTSSRTGTSLRRPIQGESVRPFHGRGRTCSRILSAVTSDPTQAGGDTAMVALRAPSKPGQPLRIPMMSVITRPAQLCYMPSSSPISAIRSMARTTATRECPPCTILARPKEARHAARRRPTGLAGGFSIQK